MRVRAWTDRQTDRQTECINTFQLCWKVLKRGYVIFHEKGCFKTMILGDVVT